ncbi:MAG: PilN domain-containing protein [Syntrophobacteraceae bacterium]|nr:PilN domain-containing protein [Syntrophobacteraceae bacterium]
MILINLLPVKVQKRKEGARQIVSIYMLTIVLAMAVMGYLWLSYNREISSRRQKLATIQSEVKKYQLFQAELQRLTEAKNTIDKKRAIIKQLQGDRDAVVRMLALLSIKAPQGKIWLDSLTQTGNSVTLDGVAESNEAIVTFMRNLQSSQYVATGSTNLVMSKQFSVMDMKLRRFQLAYRFYTYSEIQKK